MGEGEDVSFILSLEGLLLYIDFSKSEFYSFAFHIISDPSIHSCNLCLEQKLISLLQVLNLFSRIITNTLYYFFFIHHLFFAITLVYFPILVMDIIVN